MKPWSGAGGRHAAAVATIDLTTGGGKGRSDAQDPQGAASEPIESEARGGRPASKEPERAGAVGGQKADGDASGMRAAAAARRHPAAVPAGTSPTPSGAPPSLGRRGAKDSSCDGGAINQGQATSVMPAATAFVSGRAFAALLLSSSRLLPKQGPHVLLAYCFALIQASVDSCVSEIPSG